MADGQVIIRVDSNARSAVGDFQRLDKAVRNTGDAAATAEKSMFNLGNALKAAFSVVAVQQVVGMTKALLKFASDAEETQNKFNTAFRGIEQTATEVAARLAEAYNISSQESKQLLADTGDLLKGFGFTASQALDLSAKVQQLSADLVSYNNFQGGTAEASRIVTKALLGETDALVGLGTKLNQTDLKAFAESQGLVFEELDRAAKATLTYNAILAQNKDAIGDVERSQGSYVAVTRDLNATFADLQASLGAAILPSFASLKQNLDSFLEGNSGSIVTFFSKFVEVLLLLAETLDLVFTSLVAVGRALGGLAQGLFRILKGDLKGARQSIINGIVEPFEMVIKDIEDIRDGLGNLFSSKKTLDIELKVNGQKAGDVPQAIAKAVTSGSVASSSSAPQAPSAVASVPSVILPAVMPEATIVAQEGETLIQRLQDASQQLGQDLTRAFVGSIQKGKFELRDFGQIAINILGQIAQQFISQGIGQLGGKAGGFLSTILGGLFGGVSSASANGNVFTPSGIQAFAKGGVVGSPTLFGYGGGKTGLMGEAGAEAIMPLRRGANGRLGVEATPASINVYNQSGAQIETIQRPDNGTDIFIRRVNNALASERSAGSFSQALSRTQTRGIQAI